MRTRDLLEGGDSQREIDLEIALPPPLLSFSFSGWERRLDMKSGKVFFGTANSADSSVQGLNFPLTASADGRGKKEIEEERGSLEEHDFMGRNGEGNDLPSRESCEWQSVCTLDKVKMALERAEKQSGKRKGGGEEVQFDRICSNEAEGAVAECPSRSSLLAAGCPRCLLYVLLPKNDPKCPRCACSILDLTSSPAKRSRLCHTDSNGNHESDTDSPAFLFDLNSPV